MEKSNYNFYNSSSSSCNYSPVERVRNFFSLYSHFSFPFAYLPTSLDLPFSFFSSFVLSAVDFAFYIILFFSLSSRFSVLFLSFLSNSSTLSYYSLTLAASVSPALLLFLICFFFLVRNSNVLYCRHFYTRRNFFPLYICAGLFNEFSGFSLLSIRAIVC